MTLARLGQMALLSTTALACSAGSDGSSTQAGDGGGGLADAAWDRGSSADASDSGDGGESTDASPPGDGGEGGSDGSSGNPDAGSGPPTSGHTPSGVPVPSGWTLKEWDQFGTGPGSTVTTVAQLHARYYEAQFYNRDANGLVTIPNTVINQEQETYVHFETAIAWSIDHLTVRARGQPDGSITSGEMVSIYTARSFCTEAKYKIPSPAGSWPAFWFYGSVAGGDTSEIDVEQPITPNQSVSSVSMYNHPSQTNVVIADPAFTTQYMTWTKSSFDGSAAAHTYTACYDDAGSLVSRYIDGSLIYTATFKWQASLGGTGKGPDATTIVNLAVGGNWPGNVATPSTFSADLDLYYLAYYGP